ncbi:MAG: hydrogenase maturation protease [Candidatus Baltobacteraceae bacterium]
MNALVAGFGNVFFNDDGFGPEVARTLAAQTPMPNVRVRDFGTGGMHLALEMLEAYDLIVLVDAIGRNDEPGTLFVIEPGESTAAASAPDAHAMDVTGVLSIYERLRRDLEPGRAPKILIAGCVPADTGEGMTLSEPVRAAVPGCVDLVRGLLERNSHG